MTQKSKIKTVILFPIQTILQERQGRTLVYVI